MVEVVMNYLKERRRDFEIVKNLGLADEAWISRADAFKEIEDLITYEQKTITIPDGAVAQQECED